MNAPDDRDEVEQLLDRGYRADVDPHFAASLLTRLQEEIRPRPIRRWLLGGAIAAGAAIVVGLAAIMYCLYAGPSVPRVAEAPTDEVGPIVVRGRILKWDAPIAEFALSAVIHGKVNAATVYVDLSEDLRAMHRHVREASAEVPATAPAEAELSARAATLFATQLNVAAGTDMVLELGPPRDGRRPTRQGRILSWAGVADLPPRDRHYGHGTRGTIINVVDYSFAAEPQPLPGNSLRDEWGMPR